MLKAWGQLLLKRERGNASVQNGKTNQLTLTPVASKFDGGVMRLPRLKLTLPPGRRGFVDRRVLLGGFANPGEYLL